MTEARPIPRARWRELPLLAVELAARQAYFRWKWLYDRRERANAGRRPAPQHATLDEIARALGETGMRRAGVVMAHTSVAGVTLSGGASPVDSPVSVAMKYLELIRAELSPQGTLLMPTHAYYAGDPGYHFHDDKGVLELRYDPARAPTTNGLANEIFRRLPVARRSLHPLQTVSAAGPRAEEFLEGNLFDGALPHGAASPYGRLCAAGGVVISVGVPLVECFTVVHAAEDARDAEWPVRDFFRARRFIVVADAGDKAVTVRERRPLFARAYAKGQLRRDLLREGILHESCAGSLRFDWLSAHELFDFLMARNTRAPYPYFLADLAKFGAR